MSSNEIRRLLWLLPAALVLHALEEWNILWWYDARWHNDHPGSMTPAIVRTWLVLASAGGLLWTYVWTRAGSTRVAALGALVPFVVASFGHMVSHVYWLVDLGEYHPGALTAMLLVAPVTLYVLTRLVRMRAVPLWYAVGLLILSIPRGLYSIRLEYTVPDEGFPHYRLSSWLLSLIA